MNYKKKFAELKKKKEKALVTFTVLGDPDYQTSLDVVKAMVDGGSDVLELGLPFSDPIADGKEIQAADVRSLSNDFDTDKAFSMITDIRKFTDVPIGLLVYYNLIYQRGIDKFFGDAKESGVDSILVADVPVEEARIIIKSARKYGVNTVFIVSPLTDDQRMSKILKSCRGFVYLVARLGVTGVKSDVQGMTFDLIKRVRGKTKLPLCVGFGISEPKHVKAVLEGGADGAIVGSAIVSLVRENLDNKTKMINSVEIFVKSLKKETKI